mmetsp:Transcript_4871/g.11384  ORF Transcript_4871/g.11384 Transcript_4871/m.11384 type:complete len:323 (-) Transcript_4871:371-1339(-)
MPASDGGLGHVAEQGPRRRGAGDSEPEITILSGSGSSPATQTGRPGELVCTAVSKSSQLAKNTVTFAVRAFLLALALFMHLLFQVQRYCLALFLGVGRGAVRAQVRDLDAKTVTTCIATRAEAERAKLEANLTTGASEASAYALERASAIRAAASSTVSHTGIKARELATCMNGVLTDPAVRVTAGSAATGAVVLGAASGAVGATTGGIVGAACGVVPALFTFGLSIPIGTAIGSAVGLCVGTTVGGATGLVGGGTLGYGAYNKREEIRTCAMGTASKLGVCAEYVQERAWASKEFAKEQASTAAASFRSRIAGTGGSPSES